MSYGVKTWDLGKLYAARDADMKVPMRALLGIPGDAAAMPRPVVPMEERPNNVAAVAAGMKGPLGLALSQLKQLYDLTGVVKHPMEVYEGKADPRDVGKALGMAGIAMTGGMPTGVAGTGTVLGAGPTWKSGFSKVKHSMPLEEMTSTVAARPMQPAPPITVEDLQGSWVQAMPGDRTRAGGMLTHIGETKLPREVNVQGGGDYMFDNPNVWASGKGVITGYDKKITKLAKTGKPVHGVHAIMGQSSGDFSHMPAEALLGMIQGRGVPQAGIGALDDMMRAQFPEWPGVAKEGAYDALSASPGMRTAFVKGADTAPFRNLGVPDVAEARVATTKPELMFPPTGQLNTVARLQPGAINPQSGHLTYPVGLGGQPKGVLSGVHRDQFFRDWLKTQKPETLRNPANLQYSFERAKPFQYVDQELVDLIMGAAEALMATTTLSAVDKHADLSLSPDSLTATRSATGSPGWRGVRSTTSHQNGRYYFEVTVNNLAGNGNIFGVANSGASLGNYFGVDNNGTVAQAEAVIVSHWTNGIYGGLLPAAAPGNILGIYVDLDSNAFLARNTSIGGAWSSRIALSANLGTTTEVYVGSSLYQTGNQNTFNFGASGFTGSIPSYMQSWDLAQTGLYVPGWDPMHAASGITLSGSNLIATSSGGAATRMVRAMEGLRNGPSESGIDKVYFEVIFTGYGATNLNGVGLVKSTVGVNTSISETVDGWAYNPFNGVGDAAAFHNGVATNSTFSHPTPSTTQIAWDRATGKIWFKLVAQAGWSGGGDPTAGTSPTFTLTGSEVYYPAASMFASGAVATLVYSGFAGGLPADYVSILDAVTDPDESPFPTPTPTPGGGGLPISEELAAYLGLPPRPHPPMVALTDTGGRPTKAFHDYLTQQYEWERRLYTVLTE